MTLITGGWGRKQRGQENSLSSHTPSSVAKTYKQNTISGRSDPSWEGRCRMASAKSLWPSGTGVLTPMSRQRTTKPHVCAPYFSSSPSLFPTYDAQVIS